MVSCALPDYAGCDQRHMKGHADWVSTVAVSKGQ